MKAWEEEEARHAAAVVQWRRDIRKYQRECLKVLLLPRTHNIHAYMHAYVPVRTGTYVYMCFFGQTDARAPPPVCKRCKGSAVRESAQAGCDNARPPLPSTCGTRTHALLFIHHITNTNLCPRTCARVHGCCACNAERRVSQSRQSRRPAAAHGGNVQQQM